MDTNSPKPHGLSIKELLKPHIKLLMVGLVAVVGEGIADLLQPWPLKIVLDNVLQSREIHGWLNRFILATAGTDKVAILRFAAVAVLVVAGVLIYYGYINYLRGFGSFRLPSNTPIASLYAAIPLSGVLIALFTIEQLVNGIRNGFDHPEPPEEDLSIPPVDTTIQPRAGL